MIKTKLRRAIEEGAREVCGETMNDQAVARVEFYVLRFLTETVMRIADDNKDDLDKTRAILDVWREIRK